MSRDYRKLQIFTLADQAVLAVYRVTRAFPIEERFGLQSQLRRAAVSVPTNIVEGSARRSTPEFVNFLNVAAGSAAEARYLLGLACRLGYLKIEAVRDLERRYQALAGGCQALMTALERLEQRTTENGPRRSHTWPGLKS